MPSKVCQSTSIAGRSNQICWLVSKSTGAKLEIQALNIYRTLFRKVFTENFFGFGANICEPEGLEIVVVVLSKAHRPRSGAPLREAWLLKKVCTLC